MSWKNTAGRYGSVSIGLHWLTLALRIGVYACINLTEVADSLRRPPRREPALHNVVLLATGLSRG